MTGIRSGNEDGSRPCGGADLAVPATSSTVHPLKAPAGDSEYFRSSVAHPFDLWVAELLAVQFVAIDPTPTAARVDAHARSAQVERLSPARLRRPPVDDVRLFSLSESVAALDSETLDKDGLAALFESVTGLVADEHPEAMAACEDALRAQLDPSDPELEAHLGSWIVNLKSSTAKFAVSTAIMSGVLVTGGFDQIPAYVLPAVLPLLVDVDRVKLNRGDRKLLLELRTASASSGGQPVDADTLYSSLPPHLRAQISPIDFARFVDKLVDAGEADEGVEGQIVVRNQPKWIHIGFE